METTTILSISKSQKNKSKRLAAQARQANPIVHGGTCSSCGQKSTSATRGSSHFGCVGYAGEPTKNYDFGDGVLNKFAETQPMLADGTIIQRPVPGIWISTAELDQRRKERSIEIYKLAEKRVFMTSVYVETPEGAKKFSHLETINGFGDPVKWIDGAWRVVTEDPFDVSLSME